MGPEGDGLAPMGADPSSGLESPQQIVVTRSNPGTILGFQRPSPGARLRVKRWREGLPGPYGQVGGAGVRSRARGWPDTGTRGASEERE